MMGNSRDARRFNYLTGELMQKAHREYARNACGEALKALVFEMMQWRLQFAWLSEGLPDDAIEKGQKALEKIGIQRVPPATYRAGSTSLDADSIGKPIQDGGRE